MILMVLVVLSVDAISQNILIQDFRYVSDELFICYKHTSCLSEQQCSELVLGIKELPRIIGMDTAAFNEFLSTTVTNLNLNTIATGILKLKIVFFANKHLCLHNTGQMHLILDQDQLNQLETRFNELQCTAGKYLGIHINTQGIIYLEIEGGGLSGYVIRNFDLE
jgi:hypothetical protein